MRRDRCDAYAIGCRYGPAHLQRVTRCPQQQSGHRARRGLPGAPLLENASWPATGQLSSAALNQPVRKATVYWMCLNALQLHGRLDQIYTIDLVEACLSVCELPHLRLAQLVESPAAGDDPRRVRELTTNSRLLLCSFHDTDNISSVRLRARSPARLVSWGGAECDIVNKSEREAETEATQTDTPFY